MNASRRGQPSCRRPGVLLLALLACAPLQTGAFAAVPVPRHLIDPAAPRIDDPDTLVQQYLAAVERGELVVFGTALDRTAIVPVRVEYIYQLASRSMQIRVHALLKTALPVPGHRNCAVLAVSATLENGSITEIESHVRVRE